ncbi:hypothetical protein [Actinomadura madurae]|uniref:hypothetical protein n=1 Tax=Actinomadura madurae TaxID=1993 RepID=UPI000D8FE412|nr:hypothetical protein [Actinomadura madurae]SPT51236.1 Uncharacterised protein [Actinomadura madurae]
MTGESSVQDQIRSLEARRYAAMLDADVEPLDGDRVDLDNGCMAVWTRAHDGAWRLIGYQPTPRG